jgi:RND family efflux transporter MFP subunit
MPLARFRSLTNGRVAESVRQIVLENIFSRPPGVVDQPRRAGSAENTVLNFGMMISSFILELRARRWRSSGVFGRGWFVAGVVGAAVTNGAATASAASFDCVMNPFLTVKLGSPVPSILSELHVDRGDLVKKGQVIALIESSVEQAMVATNEARASSSAEIEAKQALLEQKSGVLKRKLDLQSHNVASTQDVETAQAEFNVAKQDVVLAQLNRKMAELELGRSRALLEQRTIRSPIDGVVVERTLGPGEYVRADANIATLATVDPLNVEAYLPVRYYGLIKVGDTAVVHPDEPVGGDHEAKVSIVDQVFDAASGTFGVRLTLPNPNNLLPGGLRCHVNFHVAERAATAFETTNTPSDNRPGRKIDTPLASHGAD